MSVQSISSVVNASFIQSFQGLAGSSGPAIGAGAGQGASIATGLRLGARTFAVAIQNLNATIGVVNIADDTLKKLSDLTDKMIDLAQKGTSTSAGSETRKTLQSDFEDLVASFRRTLGNTSVNGINYLTQDGLSTLFQKIGLDRTTSDGVAKVFKDFIQTNDDLSLVSEQTKGERPTEIPVLRKSRLVKISDSNISASGSAVAPEFSTYTNTNASSVTQPYNVSVTGVATAETGVTQNQDVLAVNESKGSSGETTGYTLVKSTQDLIPGQNPSNYNQVYVVAPDGSVVRQVTNVADPALNIAAADISADNKTVAVAYSGSSDRVDVISVAAISDPPATSTVVDSISHAATTVKLSNDGGYVAYGSGSSDVNLKQVGGTTDNALVGTNLDNYGWADSHTLVYLTQNDGIYSYVAGSSTSEKLVDDSTITKLAVLENDSTFSNNDGSVANTPKNSAIAYISDSGSGSTLTVANYDLNADSLKTRYRRDLGPGTTDSVSLTYQNDLNKNRDRIDVGVVGTLPSLFGDSNREMYRLNETSYATNSSLFADPSADPAAVLDGNLLTRSDSYRMLSDLTALKQQISDNLTALGKARDYLANNVSFVRKAGFAFLDLSNQLTGTEDATQVANMAATQIRQNASTAELAQIENLRNIAQDTVGLLG